MNTNEETDGQRTMDAAGWLNECLCAEKECRDALKKAAEWKARFADAVDRLEDHLRCREDCKCSGRREVNTLRGFLLENVDVMASLPRASAETQNKH